MIWSEKELYKFIDIMPELTQHEVYFISLSARNKYLNEEDRRKFMLGRSEMFGRRLIREKNLYEKTITSLVNSIPSFTTKNGLIMPEKAMVVYANINPSSGIVALSEFRKKTDEFLVREIQSEGRFKHDGFKKLDTLLMNCYQRSKARTNFIDIDCDTKNYMIVHEMLKDFSDNGIKFYTIQTKSGFHILLQKDTIKYNYTKSVEKANLEVQKKYGEGEVVINKNEMVPVPGTLQAGHKVTFI